MTRRFALPLLSLAVLGLVLAGCGGGGKKSASTTPSTTASTTTATTTSTSTTPAKQSCTAKLTPGTVATVCNAKISLAEFTKVMGWAKLTYKTQKRPFPATGSPDYETLVGSVMAFLVQRSEYEQKAAQLGVKVTDAQVEARLKQIKKQLFGGSEKRYQQKLKQQGVTDEEVREDTRSQLLGEGIGKKVTAGIKVTDAEIAAQYKQSLSQYTTPESRDVRHILVKNKTKADQLRKEITSANFAALAKKNSIDKSSAVNGGKLTISKGQTVPPFDKVAFSLKKGEISQPVHSQFGWHIIQALSPIRPKKVTPLSEVKSSITAQLLAEKQKTAYQAWSANTTAEFAPEIHYAAGYAPATTTATTTTG
jgi:parvulin-like peptidyl-prolyl isomerase